MKYGGKPEEVGNFEIDCKEMMFFMYLPIMFPLFGTGILDIRIPDNLIVFKPLIDEAISNERKKGLININHCYIYLTAKHIFASPDNVGNRSGYHSDGFGTSDINYIWSNKHPTVFCIQDFDLSTECNLSMTQMEEQADKGNEVIYPENTLLRLDEGVIHRTPDISVGEMRTFVKISISQERYNLEGNSHNHLFNYKWDMFERGKVRNHPASSEKDFVQ